MQDAAARLLRGDDGEAGRGRRLRHRADPELPRRGARRRWRSSARAPAAAPAACTSWCSATTSSSSPTAPSTPSPTPRQLAEIAIATADLAKLLRRHPAGGLLELLELRRRQRRRQPVAHAQGGGAGASRCGPTWRSTARCRSTRRWWPRSARRATRSRRSPATPTCWSSPRSTRPTSPTSCSGASAAREVIGPILLGMNKAVNVLQQNAARAGHRQPGGGHRAARPGRRRRVLENPSPGGRRWSAGPDEGT